MHINRCPNCHHRLVPTLSKEGRTELTCMWCEQADPMKTEMAKWADGPSAPATSETGS